MESSEPCPHRVFVTDALVLGSQMHYFVSVRKQVMVLPVMRWVWCSGLTPTVLLVQM